MDVVILAIIGICRKIYPSHHIQILLKFRKAFFYRYKNIIDRLNISYNKYICMLISMVYDI